MLRDWWVLSPTSLVASRASAGATPPPPVTTQVTSAATDGANTVVNGLGSALQTLELEPQPAATR